MEQYSLEKAELSQLSNAIDLIDEGRLYLKEQGSDQWQDGYPDTAIIREDIVNHRGYFVTNGVQTLAYVCIDFQGEPAYTEIKGKWLSSRPFAVVHRLAISTKRRGQGLSQTIFTLMKEECLKNNLHSIRVDTDVKNTIMQHILKKNGFVYCGTVWFANSDKVAFEKLL